MSDFAQALLLVGVYRIVVLGVGLAFAMMGHSLFVRGVYGQASDFHAASGKLKLILKNGAPGIFFSLFGMIIVTQSIWRGIDIDRLRQTAPATRALAGPQAPGVGPSPTSDPSVVPRVASPFGVADDSRLPFIFAYGGEPPEFVSAVKKAARGEALSQSERQILNGWISDRFHMTAYDPEIMRKFRDEHPIS